MTNLEIARIILKRLLTEMGYSHASASLWSTGKARPNYENQVLIKKALNIPHEAWVDKDTLHAAMWKQLTLRAN